MTEAPHVQSTASAAERELDATRLEDIDGVGQVRAESLRDAGFNTVEDLIRAPIGELIPPMAKGLVTFAAEEIKKHAAATTPHTREVEEIDGVGPQRAAALRAAGFTDVSSIRAASHEDIVRALARDRAIQLDQLIRTQFPALVERVEAEPDTAPDDGDDSPVSPAEEIASSDVPDELTAIRTRIQETRDQLEQHLPKHQQSSDATIVVREVMDTLEDLLRAITPDDDPAEQLAHISRTIRTLRWDIDMLSSELERIETRTVTVDDSALQLPEAIERVIGDISTLEDRIDSLENAAVNSLDPTALQHDLRTLKRRTRRIGRLSTEIQSIQQRTVDIGEETLTLSDAVERIGQMITVLESDVHGIQGGLIDLGETDASLRDAIDRLDSRMGTFEEVIRSLDEQTIELGETDASLRDAIERIEARISTFEEVIRSLDEQTVDLTETDAELQTAITAIDEHIHSHEERLATLESDGVEAIDSIREDVKTVRDGLSVLTAEVVRIGGIPGETADDSSAHSQTVHLGENEYPLPEALEQLGSRLDRIETALDDDPLSSMRSSIRSVEKSITEETNRLDQIESRVQALEASAEDGFSDTVSIAGQEISIQEAIERFQQRAEEADAVARSVKADQEDLSGEMESLSAELGWLYRNTIEVNLMVDILRTVRKTFENQEQLDESAIRTMNQIAQRIVDIRASMERSDERPPDVKEDASEEIDALSAHLDSLAARTDDT